MLEAMQKKGAHRPFLDWLKARLEGPGRPAAALALRAAQTTLAELAEQDPEAAAFTAKDALIRLADAAAVAALLATKDPRLSALGELYARRFLAGEAYPATALRSPELYLPEVQHA
jgi:hypothetical protein